MTQAPTPGPLSASDVKLLVKGDLLRRTDGTVVTLMADGLPDASGGETFIGRPDADGWMPWSGGENPVGKYDVAEIKRRDGTHVIDAAHKFDWLHSPRRSDPDDIIAFRIAPTAPVEASGSEREGPEPGWLRRSLDRAKVEAEALRLAQTDPQGVIDAVAALRHQPSGETREAVARIIDPEMWERRARRLDQGYALNDNAYVGGSLTKADAILALLSARPLALGGQHSGGESFTVDELAQEIRRVDGNHDLGAGALAEALTPFLLNKLVAYANHTTPARVEAQDEGAAGEPVAWITKAALENWNKGDDAEAHVLLRKGGEMRVALYAHPSPPPAADEVEKLEAERDAWKLRGDNHWETLRSIREFAREGDYERIIQWVNDAGSGYVESAEQTLGQMTDRALKAEEALNPPPAADEDRVSLRISPDDLAIVERVFLPANPNKLRSAHPDTVKAAHAFKNATAEALAALKMEGK